MRIGVSRGDRLGKAPSALVLHATPAVCHDKAGTLAVGRPFFHGRQLARTLALRQEGSSKKGVDQCK